MISSQRNETQVVNASVAVCLTPSLKYATIFLNIILFMKSPLTAKVRGIISEYCDLLIVLPMREPSIFRGISVSLLRPVIDSNVEIDVVALNWVADLHEQIAAGRIHISLQVQQYMYLLKIRLLQSSSSSCIIGKP